MHGESQSTKSRLGWEWNKADSAWAGTLCPPFFVHFSAPRHVTLEKIAQLRQVARHIAIAVMAAGH